MRLQLAAYLTSTASEFVSVCPLNWLMDHLVSCRPTVHWFRSAAARLRDPTDDVGAPFNISTGHFSVIDCSRSGGSIIIDS